MKIAILLGTVRTGRQSHRLARYVAKSLNELGIESDLIDLQKIPLPVYGTETSQHIENIGSRLKNADAIILVTPEYHGSFSGVLKNALDHFWSEFQKKPVGVVAASSGRMAGINASTQLQHVILSLGAFPMPSKLLISDIGQAFNESSEPQQEQIVKRTNKFLNEFLWFAEAIYQKKSTEKVA